MTQGTGERIYRACGRCRHRKVKCDLNSVGEHGKPPCVKCYNEGVQCVLATSRRGGDYSRHRQSSSTTVHHIARRHVRLASPSRLAGAGTSRSEPFTSRRDDSDERESGIQNPLQALELLAKVAATENEEPRTQVGGSEGSEQCQVGDNVFAITDMSSEPLAGTPFQDMEIHALSLLLENYHDTYHGFLPVVPRHLFDSRHIIRSMRVEPFIMTAVMLIATKERPDYAQMHARLWVTMQKMLLQIALGDQEVRTVGCVEGLLILAEWVPHTNATVGHINVSRKGTGGLAGSEDTAAWTLVGLAVRQAYLLHLDKYAFRIDAPEDVNAPLHRKRLAWTYTYIADRQISIRMGQAFWCRGPSLATKFTASDFPTLQPYSAYEDDYASVLQSQLELTVLFGNIHDLLYASKPQSVGLMLRGDYTKYLDDSMQGLAAWKQSWCNLNVGQHLKLLLELQSEYLRLYVHGFAFQAAISRSPRTPPSHSGERPISRFPHGLLATPDGRHINLAIGAAKSALEILGDRVDPTKHLRYLGPRYYLYAIHCAVFLFKAASYGAIESEEERECTRIVERYVANLNVAALCERHIASRHSILLTSLWQRNSPTASTVDTSSRTHGHDNTLIQQSSVHSAQALLGSDLPSTFNTISDQEANHGVLETQSTFHVSRNSKPSTSPPESMVAGLYGTDQRCSEFDVFDFLDFGAYGEPDLRHLISLPHS